MVGAESTVVGRFEISHTFVVSYVEIYMERVQDLLSEVSPSEVIFTVKEVCVATYGILIVFYLR